MHAQDFAQHSKLDERMDMERVVSIARAFTHADWRRFLREAGIEAKCVEIVWRAPFRITVARFR